jgi:hypothetical protein
MKCRCKIVVGSKEITQWMICIAFETIVFEMKPIYVKSLYK